MVLRSRFCVLITLTFALLAGCGGNSTSTANSGGTGSAGNASGSPAPGDSGFTASPSIEGTGPESPHQAGGGGIALPAAGLPIGKNAQYGQNDHCIEIIWKGAPPAGRDVVTVSKAAVLSGPFEVRDGVPADCPSGPACAGYTVTAATNIGSVRCYADLEYNGPTVTDPGGTDVDGSLALVGTLSCPGTDVATCRGDLATLQGSGTTAIAFTDTIVPPGPDGGSSPPGDQGSPTAPDSTGTESPAPAGSGSP
jgi:hypothetical protein